MFLTPFLIFAFATSRAMPPVTLEQLVDEYRRFELPIPPAGTKFIIYEWGYDYDELSNGGPVTIRRNFALMPAPKSRLNPTATIYRGALVDDLPIEFRIADVAPIPESLGRIKEIDRNSLLTAIQCQILGHTALARELFNRYEHQRKVQTKDDWHLDHPYYVLRDAIFDCWTEQISNPVVDRRKIIKHLRAHERKYSTDDSASDSQLIRALELTLAPRTAKPGSIESIFDEFVDEAIVVDGRLDTPASRKLLNHGFEAIPLIVSHLDDQRLTRIQYRNGFLTAHLSVSQICGILLDDVAGVELPRVELTDKERAIRQNARPGMMLHLHFAGEDKLRPLRRTAVDEWWKGAIAIREMDYLLDHLYRIPHARFAGEGDTRSPNLSILAMLAARYPLELERVYQKALEHQKHTYTDALTEAIVRSSLDKRTKRRILEAGLIHKDLRHRLAAFGELAVLDPVKYVQQLLRLIEQSPHVNPTDPSKEMERCLVSMCYQTNEPAAWNALGRAIVRSPAWLRFQLLNDLSLFHADGESFRQERIRTLAAFLDDATIRLPEDLNKGPNEVRHAYNDIELRNFAAIQLAPYFLDYIEYDQHRTNDEWACLRKWLKDEVAKELK